MKRQSIILLSLVLLAAVAQFGCRRRTAAPPAAPPGPKKEWTPEEIVKDPQGYLMWSDGQVGIQLADRNKRIAAIADRKKDFEAKQKMLAENIRDVENIRKYLGDACQRADDLDQWPAKMGGRTFTREKARVILEQTRAYVDERKPMLGTYDQLLRKMDDAVATLQGDVGRLQRLREQLVVELEQVKLNQTAADVDTLRKTEQKLASMSGAVASMDDALTLAPPKEPPGRVNVEEMLK